MLRLSPATARTVSTVFALLRRCGFFPGIEHGRPVVGCCYEGKLLRRFMGNIDYHVVLLRCGIQFSRLFNDSDVGKPSDHDLLHLTLGPRFFCPTGESGVGYHKSSLRGETRADIAPVAACRLSASVRAGVGVCIAIDRVTPAGAQKSGLPLEALRSFAMQGSTRDSPRKPGRSWLPHLHEIHPPEGYVVLAALGVRGTMMIGGRQAPVFPGG